MPLESSELNTDFSKVYFFLPSITDRSEKINQYMKYVNIHPFDIVEKMFDADFNPSHICILPATKKRK